MSLSPATGYHCVTWNSATCGSPVADTLHVTFVNAGAQVFTYTTGNWVCTFSWGGNSYMISITSAGSISGDRGGFAFPVSFTAGPTCPPALSATIHPAGVGAGLGDGALTE